MTAAATPPAADLEALERQAIAWLVRLQAQPTNPRVLSACDQWRSAHPSHEHAWHSVAHTYALMRQSFMRLPSSEAAPAMHALQRTAALGGRRRALGRLAAVALAVAPTAWLARRELPWQRVGADYATATGERRELVLADGSRLSLNTDSAVRVRFDGTQRRLLLDRGEIFVSSGADANSPVHRPLRVETEQGLFEALGTRFSVRLLPDHAPPASRLGVEQGAVRMQPRSPGAGVTPLVADAGQRWLMTRSGLQADKAADMDIHGWTEGLLVIQDMRLADFLAEVARYRPGHLGWDDDVAELRISGTYPLGNTTRVLALLSEALPIEPVLRTRYWTQVRRRR